MSETKASFTCKTRLSAVADNESSRYALEHVQLTPAENGVVYAGATNGRCLAIVECIGMADRQRLVPPNVLPTAKKHYGKDGEHRIDLNGKWLSSHGTYGDDETDDRRYSRLEKCLPDCSDHTIVGLDPNLLLGLLQALDIEDERLVLLIPKPDKDGHVRDAIGIVGECGIGVLMPKCSLDPILPDYRKAFNKTAEAYKAAVSTANP